MRNDTKYPKVASLYQLQYYLLLLKFVYAKQFDVMTGEKYRRC